MSRTIRTGISILAAVWIIVSMPQSALAAQISTVNAPAGAINAIRPVAEAFEATLMPQNDCLTEANVTFENLSGRLGEYRGNGSIVINPNRPVASMPTTLAHELGHHFMLACSIQMDGDFRERFFAAQSISLSRGWFDYSAGWSGTPAEHFAEAVALYATGYSDGRIGISAAALDLIAEFTEAPTQVWANLTPLTTSGSRQHYNSSDAGSALELVPSSPATEQEAREFSLSKTPWKHEGSPSISGRSPASSRFLIPGGTSK